AMLSLSGSVSRRAGAGKPRRLRSGNARKVSSAAAAAQPAAQTNELTLPRFLAIPDPKSNQLARQIDTAFLQLFFNLLDCWIFAPGRSLANQTWQIDLLAVQKPRGCGRLFLYAGQ